MEINLYAPVDCEVKQISKCTDNVFAEKMLGDGIVVIPLAENFGLPFEKAKCKLLFDTKHAYGFKINGELEALIHCGLDTVKLKGKPFNTKVKLDQNLKLNDPIFDVDLGFLKENNTSNETPIVFDPSSATDIQIVGLKEGKFKKGDLICKVSYKPNVKVEENTVLKQFKSKYQLAAEQFLVAVGGKTNFTNFYNCMTRLRFNITDQKKVDENNIRQNQLVKGINWAGNELQIIIGGEVYKVKDALERIQNYQGTTVDINAKEKKPIKSVLMGAIAGIMVPIIPVLMAVGIFGALFALTTQFGWTVNIEQTGQSITEVDVVSAVMYILQKVGLSLIGCFFCYNTVKYLGGNEVLAIFIGLILTSRFFFASFTGGNGEWEFGKYIVDGNYGISGWYLFKISDYPIVVRGYEGSVLPFILAGFLCYYSNKWIKSWMPTSIDIVFRSGLVILLTVIPTLFIAGPVLSFVEYLMVLLIEQIEKIPFGLGVAIFTLMWQPLVLTGVHVAVAMTMMLPMMATPPVPSIMMPAITIAVMGQVGAVIGVSIFTKNSNLRNLALNSIPAGIFGITEPIIYGVNLPKVKPFLIGCIGGFFGGFISGAFGVVQNTVGPQGFLVLLNFYKTSDKLFMCLAFLVAIGSAILFTAFLYKERKDEYKFTLGISKKMKAILTKMNYSQIEKWEQENNLLLEEIKSNKTVYADYEKYIQDLSKLEAKILKLNSKEEKVKTKLYSKALKAQSSAKISKEALTMAIKSYNDFSMEEAIGDLNKQKQDLLNATKEVVLKYENLVKDLETKSSKIVDKILKETKKSELEIFKNAYWNSINTILLGYGFAEEKNTYLSRKQKQSLFV